MKFLYPGHNYLGPGNPLYNGTPVDEADKIAQKHDWAYHHAHTQEDVYSADKEAINNFYSDFLKNPNLPSLAGAVGLSIKHSTESTLDHVFYPTGK